MISCFISLLLTTTYYMISCSTTIVTTAYLLRDIMLYLPLAYYYLLTT